MQVMCLEWRTKHEQAGTDRHTDSEQGRGGLVHLQLGETEGYVDFGTKGGAENHRTSIESPEGCEAEGQDVSAGLGTTERDHPHAGI